MTTEAVETIAAAADETAAKARSNRAKQSAETRKGNNAKRAAADAKRDAERDIAADTAETTEPTEAETDETEPQDTLGYSANASGLLSRYAEMSASDFAKMDQRERDFLSSVISTVKNSRETTDEANRAIGVIETRLYLQETTKPIAAESSETEPEPTPVIGSAVAPVDAAGIVRRVLRNKTAPKLTPEGRAIQAEAVGNLDPADSRLGILRKVPINSIDPQPFNRPITESKDDEQTKIVSLAKNIARWGLQQPIVLQAEPTGRFTIIQGERRFRAYQHLYAVNGKKAGVWDHISALVQQQPISDVDLSLRSISENYQRRNMTAAETANMLQMMVNNGVSDRELADALGVSVRYVQQQLSLGGLSPSAAFWFQAGWIKRETALLLTSLPKTEQDDFLRQVQSGRLKDDKAGRDYLRARSEWLAAGNPPITDAESKATADKAPDSKTTDKTPEPQGVVHKETAEKSEPETADLQPSDETAAPDNDDGTDVVRAIPRRGWAGAIQTIRRAAENAKVLSADSLTTDSIVASAQTIQNLKEMHAALTDLMSVVRPAERAIGRAIARMDVNARNAKTAAEKVLAETAKADTKS